MSVHSSQKRRRRDSHKIKFKSLGDHEEFLKRISKTLYYSKLPLTERFSLPVTELAAELYSEVKAGRSLERLRLEDASEISRNSCVSPCSLVLAILYLEQLKTSNPAYIDNVTPSDLFVVSLMVATKFLTDSGGEDDVLNSEWAASGGMGLKHLNRQEKEFLDAIEWDVFVKEPEFWKKLRAIEKDISLKEGKKRGWFSYTELENLLDGVDAFILAQTLFTMTAVLMASYTAGMLTMVGSTVLVAQLPILLQSTSQLFYTPQHIPLQPAPNLTFTNVADWPSLSTSCQDLANESVDNISIFLPSRITESIFPCGSNEIKMEDIPNCGDSWSQFGKETIAENISYLTEHYLASISYHLKTFTSQVNYAPLNLVISY